MVDIRNVLLAGQEAVRYTKSKVRWSTKHRSDIAFSGLRSPSMISKARGYEDQLLREIIKKHGKASDVPSEYCNSGKSSRKTWCW